MEVGWAAAALVAAILADRAGIPERPRAILALLCLRFLSKVVSQTWAPPPWFSYSDGLPQI